MTDVREYLIEKLKADGYDGLYSDECACLLDDLVPCGKDPSRCVPVYRVACPDSCVSRCTACDCLTSPQKEE